MILKIRVRYILRCLAFLFMDRVWTRRIVGKRSVGPNMLIIHTDAIGDYILFRNFINEIKESTRFKNHKITLLANAAYKNLAETLDAEVVHEFIWFDRFLFQHDWEYRKTLLQKIAQEQYDIAVNPTYSRDFIFADSMIRCVRADRKIGQKGNAASGYWFFNVLSAQWYTQLVDTGNNVLFEFNRNRIFTEALTEARIILDAPYLKQSTGISAESHIVLFPGAGEKQKQWPVEYFAECIQLMKGFHFYVCGGAGDFDLGERIKQLNPEMAIENLCGKTSLIELCKLIGESRLLITNDSSAIHIAACMNTPAICIGNGRHYGRFTPYPEDKGHQLYFLFPEIVEAMAKTSPEKLKRITSHHAIAKVYDVSVERVVGVIHQILNHENPAAR